jgi:hypothetical protein
LAAKQPNRYFPFIFKAASFSMFLSFILTLCFIAAVVSAESNLRATARQKPSNHYHRGQVAFDSLKSQLKDSAIQHAMGFKTFMSEPKGKELNEAGQKHFEMFKKNEKSLMATSAPGTESGYVLMRARPDSDCGGETTITSGSLLFNCFPTPWGYHITHTCDHIAEYGMSPRYKFGWTSSSTCSGNPQDHGYIPDYKCAFGGPGPYAASLGSSKEAPGLGTVGTQCSPDLDSWRAKDGFQVQTYFVKSCAENGRPDTFRHINFGVCIINVEYERSSHDDDDDDDQYKYDDYGDDYDDDDYDYDDMDDTTNHLHETRVVGYSYIKYHACSRDTNTISMTEYSDAGCTKEIGAGTVQIPPLDACFEGNHVKYTCIDKNSPYPLDPKYAIEDR